MRLRKAARGPLPGLPDDDVDTDSRGGWASNGLSSRGEGDSETSQWETDYGEDEDDQEQDAAGESALHDAAGSSDGNQHKAAEHDGLMAHREPDNSDTGRKYLKVLGTLVEACMGGAAAAGHETCWHCQAQSHMLCTA